MVAVAAEPGGDEDEELKPGEVNRIYLEDKKRETTVLNNAANCSTTNEKKYLLLYCIFLAFGMIALSLYCYKVNTYCFYVLMIENRDNLVSITFGV